MANDRRRVIIIGGGFGGLAAARALARSPVQVTLIDRTNHHLFQPLLYQVATAGLSATSIAAPIRHILEHQKNAEVLLGEVVSVDTGQRTVRVKDLGDLRYDGLILAAGSTNSYFGHDDWAVHAPGLKTLDDALEIRRRVLSAFEFAERERDPEAQKRWLHFAVIGGGPTGVEMAGTLAEIAYRTLRDEFRHIELCLAHIVLIEGSDRLLSTYPPELSAAAARQLEKLGVLVRTNCRVSAIDAEGVVLGGERISARTVIWAAGVAASPLSRSLGVALDRAGRVIVGPDLSIAEHPEVFVIGDLAAARSSDGRPVPGVSPAAKQMGRTAARNLLLRFAGRATRPFRYRDYGSLATIGRSSAVAVVGRLKFSGLPAWLFWLFLHIYFLIGFRNRLIVMMEWAWSYWTYERGARIILGASHPSPGLVPGEAAGGAPPAR